jgi:sugar fermentation stimulation protein A
MIRKGIYILAMQLVRARTLTVGRLGRFTFPPGYYIYVGSAMSGFAGRINRHLKRKKRMRWHIDYFLEVADLMWVDLYETEDTADECRLCARVAQLEGATIVADKFGASDCGCRSHLYHFETLPPLRPELPPKDSKTFPCR